MQTDAAGWFAGDQPRDEREHVFVETLRHEAFNWQVPGLRPEETALTAFLVPLHLSVTVPGLPHAVANLQVGYWPPDSGPHGHALTGEWGDEYLLDNHHCGPDGLTVIGLQAPPEEFGVWAANWLRDQLLRPVERRDWLDGTGQVTATRYVLGDTGFVLGDIGFSAIRRFRRAPDRVERWSV